VNRKFLVIAWILLLALKPQAAFAEGPYELLKRVYNSLWQVTGLNEDPPVIQFSTGESRGAFIAYDHGTFTVNVERKVFEICLQFGDRAEDALAYILGHEIAHYTSGHQWGSKFISTYGFNTVSDEVDTAMQALRRLPFWETQADLKGGIYCYLAGFDPRGIGDTLLKALYAAYPWNPDGVAVLKKWGPHGFQYDTIKPYPSLKERLDIARLNDSLVSNLIRVFEAANLSLIIGRYEDAADLLEFCLKSGMKSREVYNNLGVVYAQLAIKELGNDRVQYAYPFEVDLQSRIGYTMKGIPQKAKELLEKAKTKFRQAWNFDPGYSTALVNLAGVWSLLGDLRKARFYAEEALEMADTTGEANTVANAQVILGIISAQEGNRKQALALFDQAADNENLFASVNREVVKGTKLNKVNLGLLKTRNKQETAAVQPILGQLDDIDLYGRFSFDNYISIPVFYGFLYVSTYPNSTLYYWMGEDGHALVMQQAVSGYSGETAWGVKQGQSVQDVVRLLGRDYSVMASRQGILVHYPLHKVVFRFNANGELDNWMIYRDDL